MVRDCDPFVVILMMLSPDPQSKRPGIGVCGLQKDHNCQFSIAKGMGDMGETMTFNQTSEPEPDTRLSHTVIFLRV